MPRRALLSLAELDMKSAGIGGPEGRGTQLRSRREIIFRGLGPRPLQLRFRPLAAQGGARPMMGYDNDSFILGP